MDIETERRRKAETANAMLRLIRVEQAHGIIRPDAEAFKARMERQRETHGGAS